MKNYCISIIYDKGIPIDYNTRYNEILSSLKSDTFPIQLIADPINDIDKQFKKGELFAIVSLNKILKNSVKGKINFAYRVFENNEYYPYEDDYVWFEYKINKIAFIEIIKFIKYFISNNNPNLIEVYSDDISYEDFSRRLYKPKNFLSWIYPIHYFSKDYCEKVINNSPDQILKLLENVSLYEKLLINQGLLLILKDDYLGLDEAKALDYLVRSNLGMVVA
jgi:hypothetical protein